MSLIIPTIAKCTRHINSVLHVASESILLFNSSMATIKDTRLANLQLLKKEAGTLTALAYTAGTSPAYLSQIANGVRGLGDALARKLEAGCRKPLGWMDRDHDSPGSDAATFDENVRPANPALRPIPVISSVQAGALRDMETPYPVGSGYAIEYTDDDRLSRWAFGLDVEGLSMMPMFQPGDRIIVDPELAPNPGDFVVARNGSDQATFKKYRPRGIDHNGEMIFELVPLNDDYPTLRSDTEHLVVIGVVTEFKKKLRRT